MREKEILKESYEELVNIAGDTPLEKWKNIFAGADIYFEWDYEDEPDFNPWIPTVIVPEIYLNDDDEYISLQQLIVNIGNEFGISDYEDGELDPEGKVVIYNRINEILFTEIYPKFTEDLLDKAIQFSM